MTYQNPGNNYNYRNMNNNMVQSPMMVSNSHGDNNNRASNDDNCCDVSCCACSGCGCFYWLLVFIIANGISFQSGRLVANPEHESAGHWKSCLEFRKKNAEKNVGDDENNLQNEQGGFVPPINPHYKPSQPFLERTCEVCSKELVPGNGKAVQTACGHKFHQDCLDDAERECPVCNAEVKPVVIWTFNDEQIDEDEQAGNNLRGNNN